MSEKETTIQTEGGRAYELAFHIVSSHDESGANKVFDEITKLVESKDGKIINKSTPALLNLKYQMYKTVDSVKQRHNEAYFAWVIFEIDAEKIESIKSSLDQNNDILRYILLVTDQTEGINSVDVASMLNPESVEEAKEDSSVEEDTETEESDDDGTEVKEESIEDKVDEAIEELVK